MSTRINTNTTAVMASRNLNVNSDSESKDIERLSTGMRINSAADDAAGLVISQNMNAQLVGLNQATSNTNDAINEVKTAENALGEVQSLLMTMRQLAVNASNKGVNDTTNLAADQAEIQTSIQSINRISANTQFGTKKLLDGSATSSITTTTGSATAGGSGATLGASGRWNSGNAFDYKTLTVSAATATVASVGGVKSSDIFSGKITINGTGYDLGDAGVDLSTLNNKIQASGYTAVADKNGLTFTAGSAGASANPQVVDTSQLKANAKSIGNATVTQGVDQTLVLDDGNGHKMSSINTIGNGDGTNAYVFSNGLVVNTTDKAGVVAGATVKAVAGSSTKGHDLAFQIGANQGQVTSVSIRSTAADQIGLNAGTYTDEDGKTQTVATDSVADINVGTFKGAQDALVVIDRAINDISTIRAGLGAFQTNVLQSNVNSLNVASQNLSSSKSTITDADLASTVVQYTKDSILVQSATSALSYANQMPQQVLKLLQNA
ncbi:MAG: flagellin [Capsulimonadaceae bacterium]|nr:flagellin [Capsulimonadaceae bacterium]